MVAVLTLTLTPSVRSTCGKRKTRMQNEQNCPYLGSDQIYDDDDKGGGVYDDDDKGGDV